MLISNDDASKRLSSPLNLLNRLRRPEMNSARSRAMGLFVPSSASAQSPSGQGNREQKINQNVKVEPEEQPSIEPLPPVIYPSAPVEILAPTKQQIQDALAAASSDTLTVDNLVSNAQGQIETAQIQTKAINVVNSALDSLKTRMADVHKPEKLIDIAAKASKIVLDIKNSQKNNDNERAVHLHFYTPEQRKLESFKVIDV